MNWRDLSTFILTMWAVRFWTQYWAPKEISRAGGCLWRDFPIWKNGQSARPGQLFANRYAKPDSTRVYNARLYASRPEALSALAEEFAGWLAYIPSAYSRRVGLLSRRV